MQNCRAEGLRARLSRLSVRETPGELDLSIGVFSVWLIWGYIVITSVATAESAANDYERPLEAGKERRKLRRVTQIPSLE